MAFLQNLILSINVVAPLFLIVVVGYLLRRWNVAGEETMAGFNKVCFNVLLSCNLFSSIYNSDLSEIINGGLLTFCIGGVLLECAAGFFLVCRMSQSGATRGALMQGMFRTNLVLVGLPIASSLYGGQVGPFPLIIAVLIPIYNFLGVCILEHYRGGNDRGLRPASILHSLLRNPMFLAAVIGIAVVALGIRLPTAIEQTVNYFSRAATAVALLILGASMHMEAIKGNQKLLTISLILRLVVFPVAAATVAVTLGYRNIELLSVLMVFGCPLGTVTYSIAQQMDSDAELAGELVVFTTIFSCLSLFLQIFILKTLCLI